MLKLKVTVDLRGLLRFKKKFIMLSWSKILALYDWKEVSKSSRKLLVARRRCAKCLSHRLCRWLSWQNLQLTKVSQFCPFFNAMGNLRVFLAVSATQLCFEYWATHFDKNT